jgi:hypothetical protein
METIIHDENPTKTVITLDRVVKPLTAVTAVTAVSGLRQAYKETMPRTLVRAATGTGEGFRASKPSVKKGGWVCA